MSLLNYAYHAAPTSHKDVLSKFRTFASDQGWTIDAYEVSKDWLGPSPYSWLAGTSDFLQISSNGYGTQDIIARFHFQGTGADALSETCYFRGIKPGFGTPNNTLSTIPASQDAYNIYSSSGLVGLPSGSHIGCWFFGNDKILIAVDQITTTFAVFWWCGSMEMFDTSQDCFACYSSSLSISEVKYYNADTQQPYWLPPWMQIMGLLGAGPFWWDGAGRVGEIKFSSGFSTSDGISSSVYFTKLAYVVQANAFSGKRVLIKPTVFGKITSSGLWYPVGTMPLYHMVYAGLTFGEQLDYGGETYICFPNCFQTRKYGTAFRIA
jgi:hypothetical protein